MQRDLRPGRSIPRSELYDVTADPTERENVYARRKDLAAPLERQLDALTSHAARPAAGPVDSEIGALRCDGRSHRTRERVCAPERPRGTARASARRANVSCSETCGRAGRFRDRSSTM